MANKNRNVNIELVRVISIFFVILIHLSSPFFYNNELFHDKSFYWVINNIFYSFSRFSVPLFFIATAYIYFNSHADYKLSKRLVKVIVPYFIWSVVYFYFGDYAGGHTAIDFISKTVFGNVSTHLWFIPSFIGYIILLPLLKSYFIDSMDADKKLIGLIILFFVIIVPFCIMIVNQHVADAGFLWGIGQFNISLPAFLCFPIGLYFVMKGEMPSKVISISIFIVLCLTIGLLNVQSSYSVNEIRETFFSYTSPLVYVSSFLAFFFIMKIDLSGVSCKIKQIIITLGSCSFGIYLSHILVRDVLQRYNLIYWGNPALSPVINTIFIFLLSSLLVMIMKRIPVISRAV
ncbi:acyltransferase family protein [Serratia marcescens]|uniref:acyltransferase n=1 Tax=Serratia marcescens TaxID=615 RepID=UPI003204C07D